MLELLADSPPEVILKLIVEHRNDPRAEKIDLGVGVYRDEFGATRRSPRSHDASLAVGGCELRWRVLLLEERIDQSYQRIMKLKKERLL